MVYKLRILHYNKYSKKLFHPISGAYAVLVADN